METDFQREIFIHCEYCFYHDEVLEEEEDENNVGVLDEQSVDPLYDQKKVFDCGHTYLQHVWFDKPQKPTILEAGKISDKIFLVISGPVYIMDPMCQFEYGVLYNGSIFGDISLFFNEPNQFAYAYNPF